MFWMPVSRCSELAVNLGQQLWQVSLASGLSGLGQALFPMNHSEHVSPQPPRLPQRVLRRWQMRAPLLRLGRRWRG